MSKAATEPPSVPMTPEVALRRVGHLLDKSLASPYKAAAFAKALAVVQRTAADELERRAVAGTLTDLDGIGSSTAGVITEAIAGEVPGYLAELEQRTAIEVSDDAAAMVTALRGDCHLHSTWSDGGASIEEMAATAIELGHEYMVLTDHSARLTIAHGLSPQRLADQLDQLAAINGQIARSGSSFRILCGMEVDILEDGSLDMTDEMLERLDIVVASVHSKLKMSTDEMTPRMIAAVSNPHVDILGHCTGRKVGKRPPSEFDANAVFSACAEHGTAVEINCRPERQDPPEDLIELALQHGCSFSIDTDAHATGQLEWQPLGCQRAVEVGVPIHSIINTLDADSLVNGTWR